jgi:hypothetical protein
MQGKGMLTPGLGTLASLGTHFFKKRRTSSQVNPPKRKRAKNKQKEPHLRL